MITKAVKIKSLYIQTLFAAAIIAAFTATAGFAQKSSAAKAEFADGTESFRKGDFKTAAAHFLKAIEAEPDFVAAHEKYLQARQSELKFPENFDDKEKIEAFRNAKKIQTQEILKVYERLVLKFPESAVLHWRLANVISASDYALMEKHLLKAVALNPKFAPVYQDLALLADVRGEAKKRSEFLRRAHELEPDNADYASSYAYSLKKSDKELYRTESLKVASRFPQTERGAQSLYWLAFETEEPQEKEKLYLKLKNEFAPAKFNWSEAAMREFSALYLKSDLQKALALSAEMLSLAKNTDDEKFWTAQTAYIRDLVDVKDLTAQKKFDEGLARLEKIKPPRSTDKETQYLLNAEIYQGLGQSENAYRFLLEKILEEPSPALLDKAKTYAADESRFWQDIKTGLQKKARDIKDFSLVRYDTGEKVSIKDYRGKVVLLNFWYPFCGPCRGESPQLQKITDKFGADKFVILAVNIHPAEDQFVMPYITNNGYKFIPLRGDAETAKADYNAEAMPTNFLIDKEGKVVFSPGVVRSNEAASRLALQIEMLLR